jgi:hypothetical protein
MMKLVAERLPNTTLISISHRTELEAFHDRQLVMVWHSGGARLVRDIDLTVWTPRKPWNWSQRRNGQPERARELKEAI